MRFKRFGEKIASQRPNQTEIGFVFINITPYIVTILRYNLKTPNLKKSRIYITKLTYDVPYATVIQSTDGTVHINQSKSYRVLW